MMRQDLRQKIKKIHPKVIVSEKNMTFAHKRLLKDLQDIQNDHIPLCGVAASPLETNIFIWHVNLRGPRKTAYEGGVYHLQIRFPETYPSHPPTIQTLNQLNHPNVFSGFVCLDFIQISDDKTKQSAYEWNSSYSVQSILYQLQGFLWNQNIYAQPTIKPMVDYANKFWCNVCKHRGADAPWPIFNDKDNKLACYQLKEDTMKIESEQLKCFHTKLNFKDNQLGLGLFISKIPKTGLIKEAIIFQDYISIKAFIKQSINKTTKKEEFNHWLPLYFGKADDHEKFYFFLKRTLSMIMTNSTKYFKPEFVLQVIPKIFINLVYQIMDRNKYVSISLIRIFTSLHSIFLYCIRKHPELAETISAFIQRFIKEEQFRTKDHTSNLGCFLAYLLVSDSFKFSDLIQHYFKQQLDRHVFWILKAVPQLISKQLAQNADSVRTQLAFDCQKTSFHIICFYKLFLSHCKRRETMDKILNQYEDNLSRFTREEENQLQNGIFQIFKKVKSFQDYFQYVGLEEKSQEQINQMLKQAIVNSERKKYHSQQEIEEWQENMNLKKKEEKQQRKKNAQKDKEIDLNRQIVDYFQEVPTYQKYIQVKLSQEAQGKNEPLSYVQQQSSDQDWRELCLSRWSWIKQCLKGDHSLTPDDISNHAFQYSKNGASVSGQRLYKLHQKYLNVQTNLVKQRVKLPKMTWKTLFLRLDLQDFLKYFNMNPDFPKFYEKLFVCNKSGVNSLLLPIIQTSKIKSDYFYITAVLTKLTSLKYLEIADLSEITKQIPRKAAKAINKGLHNFYDQKGRLQIISFDSLQTQQSLSQYFFKNSFYNETITSFRMSQSNLFTYSNGLRYFSTSNFPDLQEISINNCNLNEASCKILADLVIKLKKLRIFRMNNQNDLGKGMSAIVANLAFNSALRLLDIGHIVAKDYNQLVVNLGKTIKINSNLEYLLLNDIPKLHEALSLSFWTDLGQSISLVKLDISNKTPTNSLYHKMNNLGRAIAFNAKKKGSLSFINISGSISNHQSIVELYNGMLISEYDEEEWYGSPGKLMSMIPQNYEKVFYNNLKELNFNFCSNLNPPFSLHQYKQLINPEDPSFAKLIADSPHLESLSMKSTNLTKNISDLLYVALDMNRPGRRSSLKVLNLSQNQLGSEGAVSLAKILESNHQLEVLDLSKTHIGVYGIDKISIALKSSKLRYLNLFNNKIGFQGAKSVADNLLGQDSLLEFLEIGHNRIRKSGIQILVNAVISNPDLKLAVLGLRFNYLSNQSILSSFKKLLSQPHSIKEIFLRNNLMNDFGLCQLHRICEESQTKISVDILDKSDYMNKSKANRTIWIHPVEKFTLQQLRQFFETTHKCGIIMDMRLRKGKKYPNRNGKNVFCFIEFADQSGPKLALSLAAAKKTFINKNHFRVYKSGQGNFVYKKKPMKWTRLEQARKALPPLYGMPKPITAFKVVKPNNAGLNVIAKKAANKCEERYLDHIKPRNPWKDRIAYFVLTVSLVGAAFYFLDLEQIKNSFFELSINS